MPFKQRSIGSWPNTQMVDNCNSSERQAITKAFEYVHEDLCPLMENIEGLKSLSDCLKGKTVDSVEIDCHDEGCESGGARRRAHTTIGGNKVTLCELSLPPSSTQAECNVAVFHEMIHMCKGEEIDAWSLENHFCKNQSYNEPHAITEVPKFLDRTTDLGNGLQAGTYVIWKPDTGNVWVKIETDQGPEIPPEITQGIHLELRIAAYEIRDY
jgi:hypothetical protein